MPGPALANALGVTLAGASSTSLTCAAAVPTGQLVVAMGGSGTAAQTSQTLSDSAGNTYTAAATKTDTGDAVAALIAGSNITTALTTSSTVGYSVTTNAHISVAAGAFAGCSSTAAANFYASGTAAGISSTASVTSGSVNAGDLAILCIECANAVIPSTPTGWSVIEATSSYVGGVHQGVGLFYLVPSSTGTLSPSSTVGGNWAAAIVAFPAAPTSISGTGSGSFTFTGSGVGTLSTISGTGSGSFGFTGSGSGGIAGSGSGSFPFTGSGSGVAVTPTAPAVVTKAASGIGSSTATLNGTVNPESASTTAYFQWGTTTAYGNQTPSVNVGAGFSAVAQSFALSGLAYQTYHFRIVATNSLGTTYGADQTFVPPAPGPSPSFSSDARIPFTYQLYDLRSGAHLGRLPLSSVNFGSSLLVSGSAGTASGTIDIASPAVQNLGPISITAPARTVLAIDYLGALIWGGVIWPRNYDFDSKTRKLTISATELWSYPQGRAQATDYSAPPYSGITGPSTKMPIWDASNTDAYGVYDPVLIAWQVISDALNLVTYGNILGGLGIAANSYTSAAAYLASGTALPSGAYLNVNYPYTSIQTLGTIVSQLAANGYGEGFDYAVDIAYSAGPGSPPVGTVNLSYPRRGRPYTQNNLVLNCGQAIKYSIPEDGTQAGNTVYEQGMSGSLVVSQNVIPIEGGYPILEQIKSRANIQSANILQVLTAIGLSDLFTGSFPVATPSVTMDLFSSSVPLGEFIVGDDARLLIPKVAPDGQVFDPRFPDGIDQEFRIIGYNASVPDEGQATITFNIALPPAPEATAPQI